MTAIYGHKDMATYGVLTAVHRNRELKAYTADGTGMVTVLRPRKVPSYGVRRTVNIPN